jgi:arylsulfatase
LPALVLALACSGPSTTEAPAACGDLVWDGPRPGANVILIVNDTMRRDRVGIHGAPTRTPAFDGFAGEHLWFRHAFSQAPWTKPSIATLFTSLYPSQHGLLSHPRAEAPEGAPRGMEVLGESFVTMAEILRDAGYETAAFVSNPWMERAYGLAQGFDLYDDSLARWDLPGDVISGAGLDWLAARNSDRPFFLYLHYMDSHRPYPALSRWDVLDRPETLTAQPSGERHVADTIAAQVHLASGLTIEEAGLPPSPSLLLAAYDQGVEQFDEALGTLLDGLADDRETAILVTSDHGESLFERGFDNHGNGLYDNEIAIPMAARLPGVSPASETVDCPVGLIDVVPTLCSYLGLRCPEGLYGRSLLEGESLDPLVVSEGVIDRPRNRAVRDADHKLILQPHGGYDGTSDLLFDVRADPGETVNLLDAAGQGQTAIVRRLTDAAETAAPAVAVPEPDRLPMDQETERRLRSLGYVD